MLLLIGTLQKNFLHLLISKFHSNNLYSVFLDYYVVYLYHAVKLNVSWRKQKSWWRCAFNEHCHT